ncbi:Uncharacterized membrane protein [Faunimonas pinastri]|uniref:Uncharacterized membrane protein n=1 Tax=Faunimonas pinastri TaxID=1855383 RepID=A0A1H9JI91_9HYPH|nr:DUF502 domain-containing protein [Faunimonas pinastri]SEQ86582.1 Uncharacterized membrane protein [Faunimonas pinastri]
MDLDELRKQVAPPPRRSWLRIRLRNYFLTGIIVAAPIGITFYLTWAFVHWVDVRVKPLIPRAYNPDNYLPFSVPGVGVIVAVLMLTLLGFLTANLVGRSVVFYGEFLLDRTPLVRNVYRALKQLFQTVLSESGRSFQKAGLIEYPRRGVWRLVFVSTETDGEIAHRLPKDEDFITVFVPNTPNLTTGMVHFVRRSELTILDMTIEEAAKLTISAGLVTPEWQGPTSSARPHETHGIVAAEEIKEQA